MWSTRRLIGKLGRGARNEFISTEVVNPDLHKVRYCMALASSICNVLNIGLVVDS